MKSRNKILIILGGAFIVIAIVALVIANVILGTDFAAMFTSNWAIWIYVFIGIYILMVVYLLISDRVRNL